MSKTKLTGIPPQQITDHFGSDAYRYYFLREIAFGQDGSFSWESMAARYQAELADQFGNLASRLTSMVERYRDGSLPAPVDEPKLSAALTVAAAAADSSISALDFQAGLDAIFDFIRRVNGYVTETRAVAAGQGRGARRRSRPGALRDRGVAARLRRTAQPGHAQGERHGSGRCSAPRRRSARLASNGFRRRCTLGRIACWRDRAQGRRSLPTARRTQRVTDDAPPPPEPLTVPAFDSHCHLDLMESSIEETLAAAQAVGISHVVTVGIDVPSSQWCADVAAKYDEVYATVAIHPNEAHNADEDVGRDCTRCATLSQVRAIGETGLDHYRTTTDGWAAQEESFRRHIAIAKDK